MKQFPSIDPKDPEPEEAEAIRRYEILIDTIAEGLVFHGEDGQIVDWNESALDILALSADELIGKTPRDPNWHAIRDDGSPFPGHEHPASIALQTGKSIRGVVMGIQKPSGERTWLSINAEPLFRSDADDPYGAVASFHDITEYKMLQERLARAMRFESISRVAGGLAHDFNNLLTAMHGAVDMLEGLHEVKQSEEMGFWVETLSSATEKATDLIKRLSEFGGVDRAPSEPLDLPESTREMTEILLEETHSGIELVFDIANEPMAVLVAENAWHRLINNLVTNGAEAIEGRGRIVLTLERVDVAEGVDAGRDGIPSGAYARLTVEDDGAGIDPSLQGRIFEPYFSTKRDKTGFGLAFVRGLVSYSSGYVETDSPTGAGTTFRIYLPLVEETA